MKVTKYQIDNLDLFIVLLRSLYSRNEFCPGSLLFKGQKNQISFARDLWLQKPSFCGGDPCKDHNNEDKVHACWKHFLKNITNKDNDNLDDLFNYKVIMKEVLDNKGNK